MQESEQEPRMAGTHSIYDHLLFALLLGVTLLEWRWVWPRFLKRLASGASNVRVRFYRATVLGQWLVALSFIASWAWRGMPWRRILLGPAAPWRLAVGLAAALLLAAFLVWQRVQILKHDEDIAKVRPQIASVERLLPHSPRERKTFWLVSATAGVCEEILFRGFLIWYLAAWTGVLAAVILSSLTFGLGHLYLGRAHVAKAALAGLLFACLALGSGVLWPAMLLHAAMDWNSGELGYRILSGNLGVRNPEL
jgi:CAAX protease family protein